MQNGTCLYARDQVVSAELLELNWWLSESSQPPNARFVDCWRDNSDDWQYPPIHFCKHLRLWHIRKQLCVLFQTTVAYRCVGSYFEMHLHFYVEKQQIPPAFSILHMMCYMYSAMHNNIALYMYIYTGAWPFPSGPEAVSPGSRATEHRWLWKPFNLRARSQHAWRRIQRDVSRTLHRTSMWIVVYPYKINVFLVAQKTLASSSVDRAKESECLCQMFDPRCRLAMPKAPVECHLRG